MEVLCIDIKIRDLFIILFLILLGLVYVLFQPSTEELYIFVQVIIITLLYFQCYKVVLREKGNRPILGDGRFYFYTFIFLYTVWGPITSLVAHIGINGFKTIDTLAAEVYSAKDMIATCWISIIFFIGLWIGSLKIFRGRATVKDNTSIIANIDNKVMCKRWMLIAVISTLVFLIPFIRGGFATIQSGGSILDVKGYGSYTSSNFVVNIFLFFFNSEIMTLSTAIMVMYCAKSNYNVNIKNVLYASVLVGCLIISLTTTRSARSLSIILCLFASIICNSDNKKKLRLFNFLIPISILFIYFIDNFIMTNPGSNANAFSLLSIMRRFDGLGPYDALLKSVNCAPDITMLGNIIYGAFRPIPIMGKYLVQIFSLNEFASPLYIWMSQHYPEIYAAGGGLAYMPQLEAYLAMGYLGCFLYGFAYGKIFSRERKDFGNIIIICLSFMIARGSMQVLMSLALFYIAIGYSLFDRFLLRLRKKNNVESVYDKTIKNHF